MCLLLLALLQAVVQLCVDFAVALVDFAFFDFAIAFAFVIVLFEPHAPLGRAHVDLARLVALDRNRIDQSILNARLKQS